MFNSRPLSRLVMYNMQRRNGDGLAPCVHQSDHYLFRCVLLRLPPFAFDFESGLILLLFASFLDGPMDPF